ncbi:MAG TPA: hypothetical protein VFB36_07585 [Nevskiaceae bacterium]|nr:hypothetical protein [Nevskiaceae bacterium]
MKRQLFALLLATVASPAIAQVSASITIGDPHFYGTINIGDVPEPPQLIYREPVVVEHVHVVEQPVYLHVPPGHAKHWSKHCAAYHACGRPVYFVKDEWYENVYAPAYREKHGHGHHHGDDHDQGEHHGWGHGHDEGHGHGKHKDKD